MTRPMIVIFDCETQEETMREMTEQEYLDQQSAG
jgi:hypothetical protein